MNRGARVAVCIAIATALASCAQPSPTDKAHADAAAQAEQSRRHLEALIPFDLAPLEVDRARRAFVRDGSLLAVAGSNSEADIDARFTGVAWSDSWQPTRTDLPVCFRLTRHGGSHAFQVTELNSCP